jgi:hypothetical protein
LHGNAIDTAGSAAQLQAVAQHGGDVGLAADQDHGLPGLRQARADEAAQGAGADDGDSQRRLAASRVGRQISQPNQPANQAASAGGPGSVK